MADTTQPPVLLEVQGLTVTYATPRGLVRAVRDTNLRVSAGEVFGIVGESGSGKSVTARAIMGLIDLPGRIDGGQLLWEGAPMLDADGRFLSGKRHVLDVAMIFQDPVSALNPVLTVGAHIRETLRLRRPWSRRAADARAVELLTLVGISNPGRRLKQYAHELSGGMCQRVMIAIALAAEPKLLIADEPTTALDVTIQAQIMELLQSLQRQLGLAILIITHDLGVVASLCDRLAVMYAGELVEIGDTTQMFAAPGHPYLRGLLHSTPKIGESSSRLPVITGAPPDLAAIPSGCPFHPRCPIATAECITDPPPLIAHHPAATTSATALLPVRSVRCHHAFQEVIEYE